MALAVQGDGIVNGSFGWAVKRRHCRQILFQIKSRYFLLFFVFESKMALMPDLRQGTRAAIVGGGPLPIGVHDLRIQVGGSYSRSSAGMAERMKSFILALLGSVATTRTRYLRVCRWSASHCGRIWTLKAEAPRCPR